MLCEKCQKNQASVHLSHLVNNNIVQEVHLCKNCANDLSPFSIKQTLLLPELLASLMEPIIGRMVKEMSAVKCHQCGMTYLDFKKLGRFGCAEDYEVFKNGIEQLIGKIHGTAQHQGKIPAHIPNIVVKETELRKLQQELERLVREEKFEEAAHLRDKIRAYKKNKPQ
ncbi:MAG: UvrB/UvrC motif-containing protein [Planctomycetota bacterium]|nr:UvrB/UvrC motif-containing protein [Planctomycetota bacterium]MDI6787378.1 UvrB/UvrC motif-containing protein [Planctomycetota bacterium]